jgi:pimeloyl-ACP methyl ester carboxylesterase
VGAERILRANGVDLCAQTFGDPADPAILLIAGSGGSMLSWEDAFCERLAAGSRLVVRYDQRDTGRSVTYEPGAPGYTGVDLVEDVVGLLAALGLDRAHLVGISMGGGIAQIVALDNPDRVESLTLISTGPAEPGERDLPPSSEALKTHFASPPPSPDWSDRDAVVDYVVEDARMYASPSHAFDDSAWRALARRDFDRATNIASSLTNHSAIEAGERPRKQLGEIRVPTLVIHGTEDPLFPFPHGSALASEIPDARLLVLSQTGHELPEPVWDVVIPAILEHTAPR